MVKQGDGSGRINVPRMIERAIELGQGNDIDWQLEAQQVQPHPIQTAP
jgi:hypothetical protein